MDEDYAYTERQQAERESHRDKYKQYVDSLRENRLAKLKRRYGSGMKNTLIAVL